MMNDADNSMVVILSNGKATSKMVRDHNEADASTAKRFFSRLGQRRRDSLESVQDKRLRSENVLLLEKLKILDEECSTLREDLHSERRLSSRMDELSSYCNTDINSNITSCPQCGCTRSHMSTDIYKLVEQANKNSLDNRVRLSVVEFENTTSNNDQNHQSNLSQQKQQQQNQQKQQQQNQKNQQQQQNQQHQQQQHVTDELHARLQEELVSCKLREAESCLGFKELQNKVKKLEKHWEHFMRDIESSKQSCEPNWKRYLEVKEALLAFKVKETCMTSELNELKQKLIEMETENNVYKRQEKKLKEVVGRLEEGLARAEVEKEELANSLKQNERKMDALHTQFKEQVIMHKIKEAEQCQALAALRRSKAELEIENQQLLASMKFTTSSKRRENSQDSTNACSGTSTQACHPSDLPKEHLDVSLRDNYPPSKGDDVMELLSKCDMSDIMTESFYADSVFLQNNLQALTHYDCMVSSGSNHTLHEDASDTDSLN